MIGTDSVTPPSDQAVADRRHFPFTLGRHPAGNSQLATGASFLQPVAACVGSAPHSLLSVPPARAPRTRPSRKAFSWVRSPRISRAAKRALDTASNAGPSPRRQRMWVNGTTSFRGIRPCVRPHGEKCLRLHLRPLLRRCSTARADAETREPTCGPRSPPLSEPFARSAPTSCRASPPGTSESLPHSSSTSLVRSITWPQSLRTSVERRGRITDSTARDRRDRTQFDASSSILPMVQNYSVASSPPWITPNSTRNRRSIRRSHSISPWCTRFRFDPSTLVTYEYVPRRTEPARDRCS